MFIGVIKTAAATVGFGLVHSALASRQAKELAVRLFGERRVNAFYRPLYLGQSVVSLLALALYIRRQPFMVLWHAKGLMALLMRLGQLGSLGMMAWSAHEVGIKGMSGLDGLRAWWRGDPDVPPEPEAQGPGYDADNHEMRVEGPFKISRHPLNLWALPIFWLFPRMTSRLGTFNAVTTLYCWLGSFHEESRLEEAYADAYEDYQDSGVPFFWPRPRARPRREAPPPRPTQPRPSDHLVH